MPRPRPSAVSRRILPAIIPALLALGCSTIDDLRDSITAGDDSDRKPALYHSEPDIRVRIGRGLTNSRIEGPAEVMIRPLGSGSAELAPTPVMVRRTAAGLLLTDGAAAEHSYGPTVDVEILSGAGPGPGPGPIVPGGESSAPIAPAPVQLRVDGTLHPGFLTLRSRSDQGPDRFDAVVTMPVEAYLPGVVVREVWPKWPKATMEAQSVVSRSYALHERERARRLGRGYDVDGSVEDQVYGGATSNATALEAVESTRGKVLAYNGAVLRTYFSSTCGGRPASATDTWPVGPESEYLRVAPLRAAKRKFACEESPYFRWEVTRSVEDVSQRIRAWGRANRNPGAKLTRLRSIEVVSRNGAERPASFKISDTSGNTFKLSPEELRNACNYDVEGLPEILKGTRVNSGDLEATVSADRVVFEGRGFGHGVGMCQWCAKGFADLDLTWQAMMKEFYPGAEVRRAF